MCFNSSLYTFTTEPYVVLLAFRLCLPSPQRSLAALGLMFTCMYSGRFDCVYSGTSVCLFVCTQVFFVFTDTCLYSPIYSSVQSLTPKLLQKHKIINFTIDNFYVIKFSILKPTSTKKIGIFLLLGNCRSTRTALA